MESVLQIGYALLDRGLLPDVVMRFFIRRILYAERIVPCEDVEKTQAAEEKFVRQLRAMKAIAVQTEDANKQHYEVPAEFYLEVLGPRLKYSACQFEPGQTLKEAEEATFELYMQRAGVEDGMHVLDVGCGWGSLTLYLLERFPAVTVECVSNSQSQQDFIRAAAERRGWADRLTGHKCDINVFERPSEHFDRIMSLEMFEHCKGYALLYERLHRWLRPGGKLFVHIFTFDRHSYNFEDRGPSDWMAREFFSGGTMPHHELLQRFAGPLELESKWKQNGLNYSRTLEAWLARMDARDARVRQIFARCYGEQNVQLWVSHWRAFFIACSECFAYGGGNTWYVTHYLWRKSE